MLNKVDLSDLPEPFSRHYGKAINVILTGHFFTQTLTPTAVSLGSTKTQTFTVNGLKKGDAVIVNYETKTYGLEFQGAYVSANNTLKMTWTNYTGGALIPPSEEYVILAIRREKE